MIFVRDITIIANKCGLCEKWEMLIIKKKKKKRLIYEIILLPIG